MPGSFLDSETAAMLLRGNAAPSEPFAKLLGRAPGPSMISSRLRKRAGLEPTRSWASGCRRFACRWPCWIWTGIVSLGLYPVQDSLALLERVGLHGALGTVALYGAAALDLLLGVLTLAAPARWRGRVWAAQLALIAGYTVLITLFLPEYWLHPYGPISKNVPLMAAIALLRARAATRTQGRPLMEYLAVKWLHVLSSTVLFGAGIGSAFYLVLATWSRNARAVATVSRYVVITDWVFTATTAVLQPLTGYWLMQLAADSLVTPPGSRGRPCSTHWPSRAGCPWCGSSCACATCRRGPRRRASPCRMRIGRFSAGGWHWASRPSSPSSRSST